MMCEDYINLFILAVPWIAILGIFTILINGDEN